MGYHNIFWQNHKNAWQKIKENDKTYLILLSISFLLWMLSVGTFRLAALDLKNTPFMILPFSFWIGFILATITFFEASSNKVKYLSIILLSFYTIITLTVIEPYGRMHDSIANIYDSQLVVDGNLEAGYGGDFPGFYLLIGILIKITNINPWSLSRIFPVIFLIIYISFLFVLFQNIGKKIKNIRSYELPLFLYFMLVFSPTIWLRMNPAPQTIGYLLFILTSIILIKRRDNIYFFFLFYLTYLVMVMSHPLTPILSIPGFIAIIYLETEEKGWFHDISYTLKNFSKNIIISIIVIYLSWIVYRAEGIFRQAYGLIEEAIKYEREIPMVTQNAPGTEFYTHLNVIYLLILFSFLLFCYFQSSKSRNGKMVTIWGLAMTPLFIINFGYRFFSRPLLFLSVPMGLIFTDSDRHLSSIDKKKISTFFIIFLVLLSALGTYRSQYYDNALDRPTLSEIRSNNFVALNVKKAVVATAFNLPYDEWGNQVEFSLPKIRLNRIDIDPKSIYRRLYHADTVIISQQLVNYAVFFEGKPYNDTALFLVEQDLNQAFKIYDNGYDRVYFQFGELKRQWRQNMIV
ncbi:MAG TPA: hypothetical protein ENI49_00705 [Thermoplasmatales archaeon]|nr:hypothetical protein [Thermoplasmatales archaeon]